MLRACLLVLIIAAFAPPAVTADAEKAAEAAAAFESLYGADLKRVRATRDPKDDIELAARLLAAARQATAQPEFLAVLCDNACDLVLASPNGYATPEQALQLEAATIPGKAATCAVRMVDVRQRQFDGAAAAARPAAGGALIDAILASLADRQKTGAKPDEASYYKRALVVARAVKSDRAAALDASVKALEQAARLGVEVESLRKQLAANPENPAVRLRLVRLLVVDLNHPAEAAKYVEGAQDTALAKYVPAAAKPLEEAAGPACLELGDWYRTLAETAPPAAKGAMFARAQAYYKQFLEVHSAEDINRAKAVAALQKIEADLQAAAVPTLVPSPKSAPQTKGPGPGQAIDLLALVDPAQDAVVGTWNRQQNGLACKGMVANARITIPVMPQGNCQLEVRFVRDAGMYTIAIVLPAGAGSAAVMLSSSAGAAHALGDIDGKGGKETGAFVKDGQADIATSLDGKPLIRWQGDARRLAARPAGAPACTEAVWAWSHQTAPRRSAAPVCACFPARRSCSVRRRQRSRPWRQSDGHTVDRVTAAGRRLRPVGLSKAVVLSSDTKRLGASRGSICMVAWSSATDSGVVSQRCPAVLLR